MDADANIMRVVRALLSGVRRRRWRSLPRQLGRVELVFRNGIAHNSKKIVESLKGKIGRWLPKGPGRRKQ